VAGLGVAGIAQSALAGIRVIEAATLTAAPMVGTALAEFGADVIKVEAPGGGDPMRAWGDQRNGVGLMWKSLGRNKQTVTIDLRQRRGQRLLVQLAAISDVLIVNARPSALRRWHLTYDELRQANPGIVMLQISGFGSGGPYSDRPGFGTLGEAMSGFAMLTGQPDGPPTLPPFPLADGVAALTATYAVMIALFHRNATDGCGQLIDVNLIEPLARLLEHSVLSYDQLGVLARRQGNRWGISVPRNTYRTSDGRWLAMSGSTPSIAVRVFRAIGRQDLLADPDHADPAWRVENAAAIDELVASWVATRTLDEAMATFEAHEVAAAPVYDAAQLLADPHLIARRTYVKVDDDDLGSMTVQAPVPRLSRTPGRVDHLGRDIGADTDAVLRGLLHLTGRRISTLRRLGVV
jgi:crotonobetainyl-CoA:carnitine CoA-transferase CaiB-like acyl-CoA transferase